jgi:hypothetical protein
LTAQNVPNEAEKAALIAELQQAGIKHTPEKIERITKTPDGKIVFLEDGDLNSGLVHILTKTQQFADIGITFDEIIDAVMIAITQGNIVGYQGKLSKTPRAIYEFTFKGETKYMAITISENGYIVGVNPRKKPRD